MEMDMELELEHLSFWLPDAADYLPFAAHPSPIFSPLPREYGSFLEAIEAEFSFEEDAGSPPAAPPPPQTAEVSVEDYVGGGDKGGARKRRAKAGAVAVAATAEAEAEEEESGMGNAGCKNLMSERNRRRRLNQQLLSLRSLVPCISKMDKRSILMDAATYLQNLHKEIEQIKREIAEQEASQESAPSPESNITSSTPEINAQEEASSDHHHIFKIETDEMDERTLTVKVVFRMARGAPAQVQRMIESLGASVTHTWTHEMEDHQMVTTSFINVKKQMSLTAETLKEHMSKAAIKMGFEIDLDD